MNEQSVKEQNLYVFIDESGSITKNNIGNNRYFVIALLFTSEPVKMRRRFKKKISQLMKRKEKYRNDIIQKREIKGNDISETTKKAIYSAVFISEDNSFEIGVLVLDNKYTTDKFIENHARTFNYMIQVYLNSCFRFHSRFKSAVEKMSIMVPRI